MGRKRHPKKGEEGFLEFQKQNLFGKIPAIIARKGRAKGFEALRDLILKDHPVIGNPIQAIQLALQADRHALFAEVATSKVQASFDKELWSKWQDFLHGKTDVIPAEMTGDTDYVDDRIKNPETNAEERPDYDAIVKHYDREIEEEAKEIVTDGQEESD